MPTIPGLVLYYKPTCPYCRKVTSFMEHNGISLVMKNTLDPETLNELIAINKTSQVPCLVIDGKPMLESNDIIEYLRERFVTNQS